MNSFSRSRSKLLYAALAVAALCVTTTTPAAEPKALAVSPTQMSMPVATPSLILQTIYINNRGYGAFDKDFYIAKTSLATATIEARRLGKTSQKAQDADALCKFIAMRATAECVARQAPKTATGRLQIGENHA